MSAKWPGSIIILIKFTSSLHNQFYLSRTDTNTNSKENSLHPILPFFLCCCIYLIAGNFICNLEYLQFRIALHKEMKWNYVDEINYVTILFA